MSNIVVLPYSSPFFQKDLHYHYIDMENLDVVSKDELHTHMSDGIKLGTVKPLVHYV